MGIVLGWLLGRVRERVPLEQPLGAWLLPDPASLCPGVLRHTPLLRSDRRGLLRRKRPLQGKSDTTELRRVRPSCTAPYRGSADRRGPARVRRERHGPSRCRRCSPAWCGLGEPPGPACRDICDRIRPSDGAPRCKRAARSGWICSTQSLGDRTCRSRPDRRPPSRSGRTHHARQSHQSSRRTFDAHHARFGRGLGLAPDRRDPGVGCPSGTARSGDEPPCRAYPRAHGIEARSGDQPPIGAEPTVNAERASACHDPVCTQRRHERPRPGTESHAVPQSAARRNPFESSCHQPRPQGPGYHAPGSAQPWIGRPCIRPQHASRPIRAQPGLLGPPRSESDTPDALRTGENTADALRPCTDTSDALGPDAGPSGSLGSGSIGTSRSLARSRVHAPRELSRPTEEPSRFRGSTALLRTAGVLTEPASRRKDGLGG